MLCKNLLYTICLKWTLGCATILNGPWQEVTISSLPDSAKIWIDGREMGQTPNVVTLKRNGCYVIEIQKPGFKKTVCEIKSISNEAVLGNIFYGGIIGCAIDHNNGSAYRLNPDHVDIHLEKIDQIENQILYIPQNRLEEIRFVRLIDARQNIVYLAKISWKM